MKHFIQLDVFKFVPALEKVNFVETHVNKQAQEKKPETKEKLLNKKLLKLLPVLFAKFSATFLCHFNFF